ncbi:MAG: replication protein A [ANME-2 cluster archaeon]|nr:MAG: replication protein A [ANME-2 cluster archaeon]
MKETAKQIEDRFSKMGFNIPNSEIESRLEKLLIEFKVPAEEARKSVINYFLKEYNIPKGDFYTQQGETPTVTVKDINAEENWVNLKVKVVQLWDNNHESVDQDGLMSDETGSVEFTKWANAGLPELKEGRNYQLKNVVTTRFQGRFGINLNRKSQIEEINEDIDTGKNQVISEINTDGKRISIRAKVIQLWDSNHESIGQVGQVGDETGTSKFTKWARSNLPNLEEGKSYLLKNVVTDSYQGRYQINLDHGSQIYEIEEDIEIGTEEIEFIGAMVDIQAGSGLIKRCTQCKRALVKGVCWEHSKVEGTYDLRIKAVLDNGHNVQDTLLNREVSEKLTNITLEEAVHMATEALEQSVVVDKMKEQLVGKYYSVTGQRLDRYILIETISPMPPLERNQIDALLTSTEV